MKASWKKGSHHKVDATIAFKEINKIKEANGGILTAGIIVQKAKAKTNPLHPEFEWDNVKAGDEYRLLQGRKILHSICVTYQKDKPPQRALHTVTQEARNDNPARKVYRSTEEILADPVSRSELLGRAINEALSFRRKYAELSELASIFHAVDEFTEKQKVV